MEDQGLNSVPLDQIDPSPRNPRSKPGHLEELADSMQAYGVLQPVVLRALETTGRYEIVPGTGGLRPLESWAGPRFPPFCGA
jgi:ParB family chromosome partitioning protein